MGIFIIKPYPAIRISDIRQVLIMAKRITAPETRIGKYGQGDIEEMEKLTLEKANKALSTIENALAIWDASREKPEELKLRISRLKYFYEALSGWEKKMLQSMVKKESVDARIEHLREFSDICHAYA
jgi:hypothetical protein